MQYKKLKATPVGKIVADNYHTADVFRKFGIDFCCGGHKTLESVTAKKGISADEIAKKLTTVLESSLAGSEDYNSWSPSFLIDYIENTHHRFVESKIPQIMAYGGKVANVHGERHPENIEIYRLFELLSRALLDHLADEEENVFPLIREYTTGNTTGVEKEVFETALEKLVEDHEEAGEIMARIRELSNQFTPPPDACTTYQIFYQNLEGFEKDLHKHVHLENNILFKKAESFLEN